MPKSKKAGMLPSTSENSPMSRQVESEHGRPSTLRTFSQMSRVLSPIPGYELLHHNNSLQTPREEQKRNPRAPPAATPSSTTSAPVKTPETRNSDDFECRSSSSVKSLGSFHTAAMRQTVKKAVKRLGFRSSTETPIDFLATSSRVMESTTMVGDKSEDEDVVLRPYIPEDRLEKHSDYLGAEDPRALADPDRGARDMNTASRISEEQKHTQVALQRRSKQETGEQIEGKIARGIGEHQDTYKLDLPNVQGLRILIDEEIDEGRQNSYNPNLDSRHGYGLGIRLGEKLGSGTHEEPREVSSKAFTGDAKKDEALECDLNGINNSYKPVEKPEIHSQVQEDPYFGLEALEALGGGTGEERPPQSKEKDVFAPNFYTTRMVGRRNLLLERPELVQAYRLRHGAGRASVKTPEVAATAPRQDSSDDDEDILPSEINPQSSRNTNLEIIDHFLEQNYRAQAETIVRKASASFRSRSSSARNTPNRITPSSASSGPFSLRIPSAPAYITPTRQNKQGESSAPGQGRLFETPNQIGTPSKLVLEPYTILGGSADKKSALGPVETTPHTTYGHVFLTIPFPEGDIVVAKARYKTPPPIPVETRPRTIDYFTEKERQDIAKSLFENYRECRHEDCVECLEREYAYYINKAMPTSMPPEERQKIINNNRSLRNIKNELESLAEHAAISDDIYDKIMSLLPVESSLNGSSGRNVTSPSPTPSAALSNLSLNGNDAPPAYNNPTPPSLPGRQTPAPPTKPEIWRATALYRYEQAGDCNFEVGDQISVHTEMNQDWWMGKNLRTGQEGVFPSNYVQRQMNPSPVGYYGNNEKANAYPGGYPGLVTQQHQQQGPPPPGPSNPYNSSVPPMAVAEQPMDGKPSKGQEMGKKFGKKLGNAAIFGAGATIGGNLVNSIF